MTDLTEYGDIMLNPILDEWGRRRIDSLLEDGTKIIILVAVPYTITLTETLGLVDFYSRTWTAYRTYSELLGLTDIVSKEPRKTFPESLGLVDSVQKEPSKTFPESLGLVDTYSRVWSTYRTFSELLGLSDVILKSSAITKTEALGLVDAYSRVWNAYRTYSETLGLVDSVFRAVTLHPLTETLGLFDALEKSPSKTFTETLGLLDTVSAIRALIKVLTETLGLKDTFSRTWNVQRTYTEALGLKDYVSKSVTLHALVEVLGLLDSIRYGKNVTVLAKLIKKYLQLEGLGGSVN